MRNSIRFSGGYPALRSAIPRWISTAHRTASTTLGNSAKKPSPVFFTIAAPVLRDLRIDQLPEVRLEPLVRPLLIRTHQARVPGHVGGEDRGEAADRGHCSAGRSVGLTKCTLKPAAALALRSRVVGHKNLTLNFVVRVSSSQPGVGVETPLPPTRNNRGMALERAGACTVRPRRTP